MIRNLKELEVYNLSMDFAMDIFEVSKRFPSQEKYSLIDQIRRSSRSISANVSEGWGKRKYVQVFKRQLIDALGSLEETKTWLEFSNKCNYISIKEFEDLIHKSEIVGSKIYRLYQNWK